MLRMLSLALAVMCVLAACSRETSDSASLRSGDTVTVDTGAGTTEPTPVNQPDSVNRAAASEPSLSDEPPRTKIETLKVEMIPEAITLRIFDEGFPFLTYYPEDLFTVKTTSSGEGSAVRFVASYGVRANRDAYVSIFVPAEKISADAVNKRWIQGKNGLIATNGWETLERLIAPEYPWVKETWAFKGANEIFGRILLGEVQGQGFYVVLHYHATYGMGFIPRARPILSNLRWKGGGTDSL